MIAHGLIALAEHFGRLLLDDRDYDVDALLATADALLTVATRAQTR